jgi:hypothetical protein
MSPKQSDKPNVLLIVAVFAAAVIAVLYFISYMKRTIHVSEGQTIAPMIEKMDVPVNKRR